jgi:hypothetical protein
VSGTWERCGCERGRGSGAGVSGDVGAVRAAGRAAPARALAALAGLLCAAALLMGCGASIELPDLFVVYRSGSVPGAGLTLVVNEGGSVHCGGSPAHPGPTRQLSDPQLVLARGITEELQGPSSKHLSLPPRPGSVFRYFVRDAEGTVRFADNSAGQPSVLRHFAYLVLEIAQRVCGLPS